MASNARRRRNAGGWRHEVSAFLRALAGAFLFGLPLLYTMEMWWLGAQFDTATLLALLAIALLANLGLAYYSGFRRETGVDHLLEQAIDAMAVGTVAAAAVLLVLNRIYPGLQLGAVLGSIIVQAVPLSIGASVANAVFAHSGDDEESGQVAPRRSSWSATANTMAATIVGAVFISFTIAPTEEIPMLAAQLTTAHLVALIGLSLGLTYCIDFVSGFDPEQGPNRSHGIFHTPLTETTATYVVSLLVALGALLLFAHIRPEDLQLATSNAVALTLVLGFPAAIGGAAGRLVV